MDRIKRIWAGDTLADNAGLFGPPPVQKSGPELLIGGYGPAMIRRFARWVEGDISVGAGTPARLKELCPKILQVWQKAGISGKPRFVTGLYIRLGPHAAERIPISVRDYYAFLGPNVENMVKNVPTRPEELEKTIRAFAEVGMDKLAS